MITKIDIIQDTYSQMRISGLTVNPTPEDVTLALSRLESMMAELESSRNICVGYNFEVTPDVNSLTNVDLQYKYMMATSLAIRLVDFNKLIPPVLTMNASAALSTASSSVAADNIRMIQPPNRMPVGSGTSLRYNKYQRFNRVSQLPPNECATHTMIIGDINDFDESFESYLNDAETIASYTIVADRGITLISDVNNDPLITFRIEAEDNVVSSGLWQQVKIVMTTSEGRVETRLIDFEIESNKTVNNN